MALRVFIMQILAVQLYLPEYLIETLDLLQVDSNSTGKKVVRRARAPERSPRGSELALATSLRSEACAHRTTFLPVQFESTCSKSIETLNSIILAREELHKNMGRFCLVGLGTQPRTPDTCLQI